MLYEAAKQRGVQASATLHHNEYVTPRYVLRIAFTRDHLLSIILNELRVTFMAQCRLTRTTDQGKLAGLRPPKV